LQKEAPVTSISPFLVRLRPSFPSSLQLFELAVQPVLLVDSFHYPTISLFSTLIEFGGWGVGLVWVGVRFPFARPIESFCSKNTKRGRAHFWLACIPLAPPLDNPLREAAPPIFFLIPQQGLQRAQPSFPGKSLSFRVFSSLCVNHGKTERSCSPHALFTLSPVWRLACRPRCYRDPLFCPRPSRTMVQVERRFPKGLIFKGPPYRAALLLDSTPHPFNCFWIYSFLG